MMKQNHEWIKQPFKVQNVLNLFVVKRFRKFIDMVSDFTSCFTKVPLVQLWYKIKKEYSQLSEKAIHMSVRLNF